MGFLLMQFEYQRANSQYNLCERTGIRLNDQLEKYTKRVENMQSLFSKAESRLEKNWSNYSNQFSAAISSAQNDATGAQLASVLSGIRIGGVSLGSFIAIPSFANMESKDILTKLSSIGAEAKAVMQQLIQNAQDADIDKLHAQQDAQLDPIQEKETDIEGKVACNDTLTTIWQQRRDNAKERLGQDIENGLAHYGLK